MPSRRERPTVALRWSPSCRTGGVIFAAGHRTVSGSDLVPRQLSIHARNGCRPTRAATGTPAYLYPGIGGPASLQPVNSAFSSLVVVAVKIGIGKTVYDRLPGPDQGMGYGEPICPQRYPPPAGSAETAATAPGYARSNTTSDPIVALTQRPSKLDTAGLHRARRTVRTRGWRPTGADRQASPGGLEWDGEMAVWQECWTFDRLSPFRTMGSGSRMSINGWMPNAESLRKWSGCCAGPLSW